MLVSISLLFPCLIYYCFSSTAQSSSCGPSQLVSSAESSSFLLSQQSSQDWFELNKSPREKLNEALHDLSSKEFGPIASQVSSPWEDLGKSSKYYYIQKAREAVMIVLSVIAPGQEEVLLKNISSLKTDYGPGDHITHQLKEAYYATSDKRPCKILFY